MEGTMYFSRLERSTHFPFSSLSMLCLLRVALLSWMLSPYSPVALPVRTDAREEFGL
jgi:hypothetical protein